LFYVYILVSESSLGRYYVGLTVYLKTRLREHNDGKSVHTSKYVPWKLASCIAFADRAKAFRFERYLRSGSGRAFAKKHF